MQTNIHPPFPEDILAVRNIVRGGTYFWGHFSLERVRRAVAYNRSQLKPDLPVEGESETDMEEFVTYDIPGERERSRSPKKKQISVEDYGAASGSCADQTDPPGSNDFAPDLNGFFYFGMPSNVGDSVELKAYRMCNGGLHLVTETLKACMALFKAEVPEKELARLKE
ncbi:hypothetical protein HID58_042750 [Brassica napus]|uniref:Uncharacterized protein n=1 Tax=Brassica napus TaxID=3708 RepID=A0ABQ8BFN5_BRANA|nr:hypothetical protein HID58_042750 [Brassica napus]